MPDTPTNSESKPPEIVMIPTGDLYVPDWNPRKYIDEGEMRNLMAYREKGGQIPPILVWKSHGQPPQAVISGQRRVEADRRLGKTQIAAILMDITFEEAKIMAITSNEGAEVHWLDKYESWEAFMKDHEGWSQERVGTRLGVAPNWISRGYNLTQVLNGPSRQLIKRQLAEVQQALLKTEASQTPDTPKKPKPWTLTEFVAFPLTALLAGRPTEEAQTLAEGTLKVVMNHKMAAAKVEQLVEWVKAGNPPETFGTAPKAPKTKKGSGIPPEALDKAAELAEQVGLAKGRGEDPKPYQDRLDAYLTEVKAGSGPTKPGMQANGNIVGPLAQPNLAPRLVGSAQMPSDPILNLKGLGLLKQKIKNFHKAVFKPATGTPTPNDLPPNSIAPHLFHSSQKQSKVAHWFEKAGKRIGRYAWHKFVKYEHRFCKEIAKEAVPEHYTVHSGHKGANRGFLKGATTLALTLLHWAVYGVCQFIFLWAITMGLVSRFVPFLRPAFEWPFRFAVRLAFVDFPAWVWAKASGNLIPALLVAAGVLWLFNLARKAEPTRMGLLVVCLAAGLFYGHRWGTNADMALVQPNPAPQPVASAQVSTPIVDVVKKLVSISKSNQKPKSAAAPMMSANGNINRPLAQPSHVAQLEASQQVYQPAIAFQPTTEDPKILELEIAAYSDNSITRDFSVTPDEGIPGDLAVTRMQGVMDPDKYTLMIGSDKQSILGINVTTTTMTIQHKSADPLLGGIFGNNGPVNIVLEDVTAIHISEIDTGTKTTTVKYQFSLISEGAKYPLTIQCNSTDDLRHLVSAIEYFIRNSRLGHDTPLTGMPYLLQGLRLDQDSVVKKLWADSPADKAGLQLGDHLWSIGKATKDQQEKKDFEKALSSLANANINGPLAQPNLAPRLVGSAQVPVTLFVASDSDWTKAKITAGMDSNAIHPKLRKIILEAGK